MTTTLNKVRPLARLAGILYLFIAIVGGFSIGYVQSAIVEDGNAVATFNNLKTNLGPMQMGISGDIVVLVLETWLTVLLFQLFRGLGKTEMLIATFSRLAMAIIMAINLVIYLAPYVLVSQSSYVESIGQTSVEAWVLLFYQLHKYGELAWQVFFAIHLFSLGFVLKKGEKTPKALGWLMLIGSFGYAGDSITQLVQVNTEQTVMVFGALLVLAVIAEFWFAFWLVIKGKVLQEVK